MHYSSKDNINKNKNSPAISLQKASPRAPAFASPSAACSRAPPQHQYCCTGETRPRTTETAKATRGFGRKNQQTGECNASDSAQAGSGLIYYLFISTSMRWALGLCKGAALLRNAKRALFHVFIFIIFWGVRFTLAPQSLRDYKYLMPSERKTKPSRNDN